MNPTQARGGGLVLAVMLALAGTPAAAQQAADGAPGVARGTPDLDPGLRQDLREETRQEPGEAQAPMTSGGKVEKVRMRTVEQALKDLGYAPGPIDGVIDDRAEAAIRAYQADRGQPVNGEVTPELIAALEAGG